jgi:hypothetical protein
MFWCVASPVVVVELTLLWSQIDEDLESVGSMGKERTESPPRFSTGEHLPPQYEPSDYVDTPPEYDRGEVSPTIAQESKNRPSASNTTAGLSEKMKSDLEAVTTAVDRLYLVAPQLHDQRVELKSTKLKQMENARTAGSQPSTSSPQTVPRGKQKESDVGELEDILDLLGKAADRKLTDQSVTLEGGMKTKFEEARIRDQEKVSRSFFDTTTIHLAIPRRSETLSSNSYYSTPMPVGCMARMPCSIPPEPGI